jgi:hypothetical protein
MSILSLDGNLRQGSTQIAEARASQALSSNQRRPIAKNLLDIDRGMHLDK